MTDVGLDEKIADLKRRTEEARAEQAKRAALADQARAAHDRALAALRELGHGTPESALEEAERIRADVERRIEEASEQLARARRKETR